MSSCNTSSASDVDDLRFRITQLEELISAHSETTDASNLQNSSLPSNVKLSTNQRLIDRINTLESLLAASELDNSNLRKDIEFLKAEQKLRNVEASAVVAEKCKEIKRLESDLELCKKQGELSAIKLESIQAYINTLPSNEELLSAEAKIKLLETELQAFQAKCKRYELRNERLQEELVHKEVVCQDALNRIEHLRPMEMALEEVVKDENELDYANFEDVKNYIIGMKSQLLHAKELLAVLKRKNASYNEEKKQFTLKINIQNGQLKEYEDKLKCLEMNAALSSRTIENLEKQLNASQSNCLSLESDYNHLVRTLELRQDQFETLIKLVTEVELCVLELSDCLSIAENFISGKEPDVEALLGLVEYQFGTSEEEVPGPDTQQWPSQHAIQDKHGSLNVEWCLSKWKKVKDVRAQVDGIRKHMHSLYVKSAGERLDMCAMQ